LTKTSILVGSVVISFIVASFFIKRRHPQRSQWVCNVIKAQYLLVLSFSVWSGIYAQDQKTLVNFGHLEHLTEKIVFLGDTVSIVHVYANYPSYEWVDAKESGTEGIACVDDAARAAVLYLRDYELNRNKRSLDAAKLLLKFVRKMETDDGMFYNFIFADHTINKEGKTSFKSFGWWAARGVWAMSMGCHVFRDIDSGFAAAMRDGVDRTFPHIDSLSQFREYETISSYRVPQWLLYESGADATSELLLGLIEYYQAVEDRKANAFIRRLTDGLTLMQEGDIRKYPFGLHRSWKTMWHMWGNGQTQALATAANVLQDKGMLRSGEREAKGFYSRLLIKGFIK